MNFKKALLAGAALAVATAAPAQASIVDNPHFKVLGLLGLVIVWGADASDTAPVVSDFVIDTGTGTTAAASGDADLISDDVHTVITGSLSPTPDSLSDGSMLSVTDATSGGAFTDGGTTGQLDAADAFTAFGLDGTTDIAADGAEMESSFYVASNTAFAIDAEASATTSDNFALTDVGFDMAVTQSGDDGLAFGSAAQFPHSGGAGGGVSGSISTLDDLSTAANVFTGDQRTAASTGSIADQSVRFDVTYSLGGAAGYDLSMGAGEIEADVTYTVFVP
ncbi:MAG: hypothetical protein GVY06_04405 [Alphaproteobacteria bacterium]|nr:hypothetical protein [Alphaproteobacteria bacterium]